MTKTFTCTAASANTEGRRSRATWPTAGWVISREGMTRQPIRRRPGSWTIDLPHTAEHDPDGQREDGRIHVPGEGEHAEDHPRVLDSRSDGRREEAAVGVERAHGEGARPRRGPGTGT